MVDLIYALLGGVFMGTAAALYLFTNGRSLNTSRILAGVIDGTGRASLTERLCFLAGLVITPFFLSALISLPAAEAALPPLSVIVAAGMLMGLGARFCGGCILSFAISEAPKPSWYAGVIVVVMLISACLAVMFVGPQGVAQ